jgi:hypothetical protein
MEVSLCESILKSLERMDGRLVTGHSDLQEIAGRMDRVIDQISVTGKRFARMDERLERVEYRLGYREAVH